MVSAIEVWIGAGDEVVAAIRALVVCGDWQILTIQLEFAGVFALLGQVADGQHREIKLRAGTDEEATKLLHVVPPFKLQLHAETLVKKTRFHQITVSMVNCSHAIRYFHSITSCN